MSKLAELQYRIATIFSRKMNLEVPSIDTDLIDSGAIDSLAFVDLLLHLEQEFGVSISVDELEIDHFRSIVRIAEFVATRNGRKETP